MKAAGKAAGMAAGRAARWAVVPLLLVLAVPGRTTLATWTDAATVAPPSPHLLRTGSLVTAPLTCQETFVGLTDAARISWTPTTSPAVLTYTARVVQTGGSLTVSSNSSVTLTASLLSTLLGATVTIRITGTLPGTGWTTSADQEVSVGLAGLWVDCA